MKEQYRNKDIKNCNLANQDLSGCDFSYSDIRGANFENANLSYAIFNNANANQSPAKKLIVHIAVTFFLGFLGSNLGYAICVISSFVIKQGKIGEFWYAGIVCFVLLMVSSFIILRGEVKYALAVILVISIIIITSIIAIGSPTFSSSFLVSGLGASGAIGAILGLSTIYSINRGLWQFVLPILGSVLGASFGSKEYASLYISLSVCLILVWLSFHIGKYASKGDPKFIAFKKIGKLIHNYGRTNFKGSNLNYADFTDAQLEYADFKGSNLRQVCWLGAKKLYSSNTEGTYLSNDRICRLVNTKDGQGSDFSYLNLRGLNLDCATLEGADFTGTDLTDSTLKKSNLTRSKLVRTQLYRTDLSNANLTGAFIEDWGISTDTNIEGVLCDYIYMRLPTSDDPDPYRKPDNRNENFKKEDFQDFIAPIIKILSLYRHQDFDPREIGKQFKLVDFFHDKDIKPNFAAIALSQLAFKFPSSNLRIVSLEGRGGDKLRLQAQVSNNTDSSTLSQEYLQNYKKLKSLSLQEIEDIYKSIKENNKYVAELNRMLETARSSNKFYFETNLYFGDIMSNKEINITAGGNIGNVTGVSTGDIINNSRTNYTTESNHENSTLTELKSALENIREIVNKCSSANKSQRENATNQISVLENASKSINSRSEEVSAKKASERLKEIISGVGISTSLLKEVNKAFEIISKFFGF